MLTMYDRLYGKIELPDLAWELATTCPVLLRLREIRMGNIPFFTHPSFANVDRYEHSVGVAHLAWRWARSNKLPTDLATALTIAALYHDGATPAFSHLFEEFLGRFGFDHESELEKILMGTSDDLPGGESAQVFLGRRCRLRALLPRPTSASSPLTVTSIADMVAGKGPIGRLVKGDIDIDNIDNVIRAATAMGVLPEHDRIHPYSVIDAIELVDGTVRIRRDHGFAVAAWESARFVLYDSILNNAYEFRAQSALKWAIEECSAVEPELCSAAAWRHTEPILIFEYLRKHPFSRALIDRLRLGNPPALLFSVWLPDLGPFIGRGGETVTGRVQQAVSEILNMEVYVNYYVDKRRRRISLPWDETAPLFPDTKVRKSSNISSRRLAGVVGVVGISRVERLQIERDDGRMDLVAQQDGLSMKAIDKEALANTFESILREKPSWIQGGWIGSRPHLEQLSLAIPS